MARTHQLLSPIAVAVCLVAVASVARADSAYKPAYTPEQQKSALGALQGGLASLDQIDHDLAGAYGNGSSRFKTKLSQGMKSVKGLFARFRHPDDLAQQDGKAILERTAALQSVTQACAVSRASVRAIDALSKATSALLAKRNLATPADIKEWMTPADGGSDSSGKADEVLDCASARKTLEGAIESLQGASAKIDQTLEQQPEGVLVPHA